MEWYYSFTAQRCHQRELALLRWILRKKSEPRFLERQDKIDIDLPVQLASFVCLSHNDPQSFHHCRCKVPGLPINHRHAQSYMSRLKLLMELHGNLQYTLFVRDNKVNSVYQTNLDSDLRLKIQILRIANPFLESINQGPRQSVQNYAWL